MQVTRELKLKARVGNFDDVHSRLRTIARFVNKESYLDYFFKSETNKEISELRLRSMGHSRIITVKTPVERNRIQVNTEYTFAVGNADDFLGFLETLGFHAHTSLRKNVEIYIYGSITVQLAEVEGLGSFVEIVMHIKDHAIDDAKAAVEAAAVQLGLKQESFDSRYYSQIKEES